MYYKEEIINGIMCFKHSKDGEWIPLCQKKLTRKILKMQLEIDRLLHKLNVTYRRIHEPILKI